MSVLPERSRIVPRAASTRTVRTWFSCAACRYRSPASTSNAQSRRKSTAKTASASAPSTPTRIASCGVKRYGSATRGSGGRNRCEGERRSGNELAIEAHLRDAVGRRDAPEHGPAEREDRRRDEQVQRDAGQERLEERAPRRHLLAEQEVEPEPGIRDEDRDDHDGEQRRVRAVAARRLAVAPGPVAGEGV